MSFNLNALAGKRATTIVPFMDQSAKVTFDPSVLTAAAITKAETNDDEFTEFFCRLVTDWDVVRGAKKVILKPENLHDIPLVFLRACFKAVMEDASSGEAVSNSNAG